VLLIDVFVGHQGMSKMRSNSKSSTRERAKVIDMTGLSHLNSTAQISRLSSTSAPEVVDLLSDDEDISFFPGTAESSPQQVLLSVLPKPQLAAPHLMTNNSSDLLVKARSLGTPVSSAPALRPYLKSAQPVILVNNEGSMEMIDESFIQMEELRSSTGFAATPTTVTQLTPPSATLADLPKQDEVVIKFEPVGFGEADVGDEVVEVRNSGFDISSESMALSGASAPLVSLCRDDAEGFEENGIMCMQTNASTSSSLSSMPHQRESCPTHIFKRNATVDSRINVPFCPNCFCYICDVRPDECGEWATGHCNATHKNQSYKAERNVRKNAWMSKLLPPKTFCALFKQHSKLLIQIAEESTVTVTKQSAAASTWNFLTPIQSKLTAVQSGCQAATTYLRKYREVVYAVAAKKSKAAESAHDSTARLMKQLNDSVVPSASVLALGAMKIIHARGLSSSRTKYVDDFAADAHLGLVEMCLCDYVSDETRGKVLASVKTLPQSSVHTCLQNVLSAIVDMKEHSLRGFPCDEQCSLVQLSIPRLDAVMPTSKRTKFNSTTSENASGASGVDTGNPPVNVLYNALTSSEKLLLFTAVRGYASAVYQLSATDLQQSAHLQQPRKLEGKTCLASDAATSRSTQSVDACIRGKLPVDVTAASATKTSAQQVVVESLASVHRVQATSVTTPTVHAVTQKQPVRSDIGAAHMMVTNQASVRAASVSNVSANPFSSRAGRKRMIDQDVDDILNESVVSLHVPSSSLASNSVTSLSMNDQQKNSKPVQISKRAREEIKDSVAADVEYSKNPVIAAAQCMRPGRGIKHDLTQNLSRACDYLILLKDMDSSAYDHDMWSDGSIAAVLIHSLFQESDAPGCAVHVYVSYFFAMACLCPHLIGRMHPGCMLEIAKNMMSGTPFCMKVAKVSTRTSATRKAIAKFLHSVEATRIAAVDEPTSNSPPTHTKHVVVMSTEELFSTLFPVSLASSVDITHSKDTAQRQSVPVNSNDRLKKSLGGEAVVAESSDSEKVRMFDLAQDLFVVSFWHLCAHLLAPIYSSVELAWTGHTRSLAVNWIQELIIAFEELSVEYLDDGSKEAILSYKRVREVARAVACAAGTTTSSSLDVKASAVISSVTPAETILSQDDGTPKLVSDKIVCLLIKLLYGIERGGTMNTDFHLPLTCWQRFVLPTVEPLSGSQNSCSTGSSSAKVQRSLSTVDGFPVCPALCAVNLWHSEGEKTTVPECLLNDTSSHVGTDVAKCMKCIDASLHTVKPGKQAYSAHLANMFPCLSLKIGDILGNAAVLRMLTYHLNLLKINSGQWYGYGCTASPKEKDAVYDAEYTTALLCVMWSSFLQATTHSPAHLQAYMKMMSVACQQFGNISSPEPVDVCSLGTFSAVRYSQSCMYQSGVGTSPSSPRRVESDSNSCDVLLKIYTWDTAKYGGKLSQSYRARKIIPFIELVMLIVANLQEAPPQKHTLLAIAKIIMSRIQAYVGVFPGVSESMFVCCHSTTGVCNKPAFTNKRLVVNRLIRFWNNILTRVAYMWPNNACSRISLYEFLVFVPFFDYEKSSKKRITPGVVLSSYTDFPNYLGLMNGLIQMEREYYGSGYAQDDATVQLENNVGSKQTVLSPLTSCCQVTARKHLQSTCVYYMDTLCQCSCKEPGKVNSSCALVGLLRYSGEFLCSLILPAQPPPAAGDDAVPPSARSAEEMDPNVPFAVTVALHTFDMVVIDRLLAVLERRLTMSGEHVRYGGVKKTTKKSTAKANGRDLWDVTTFIAFLTNVFRVTMAQTWTGLQYVDASISRPQLTEMNDVFATNVVLCAFTILPASDLGVVKAFAYRVFSERKLHLPTASRFFCGTLIYAGIVRLSHLEECVSALLESFVTLRLAGRTANEGTAYYNELQKLADNIVQKYQRLMSRQTTCGESFSSPVVVRSTPSLDYIDAECLKPFPYISEMCIYRYLSHVPFEALLCTFFPSSNHVGSCRFNNEQCHRLIRALPTWVGCENDPVIRSTFTENQCSLLCTQLRCTVAEAV
jgi:hypothetical protein